MIQFLRPTLTGRCSAFSYQPSGSGPGTVLMLLVLTAYCLLPTAYFLSAGSCSSLVTALKRQVLRPGVKRNLLPLPVEPPRELIRQSHVGSQPLRLALI